MADLRENSTVELMVVADEEEEGAFIECRVCMKSLNESSGRIFLGGLVDAGEELMRSLQDILSQICQVQVDLDDGLPDVVCEECREALLSAYKLQLTAQHSDGVLRTRQQRLGEDAKADEAEEHGSPFKLPMLVVDGGLESGENYDEEDDPDAGITTATDEDQSTTKSSSRPASQRQFPECEACGKQFRKAYYLNRHKAVHLLDPNKPFQCRICYKRFHIDATLQLHLLIHDKSLMAEHLTEISNPNFQQPMVVYSCQECGDEFVSQESFDEHWKLHEVDTIITTIDEEEQEDPQNSTTNAKTTAMIRNGVKLKCPDCGYLCNDDVSYSRHMRTAHDQEASTYSCNFCGIDLPMGALLIEHLNQHEEVKPFQCPDCDKSFRTSSQLKAHTRIHQKDPIYLCSQCGKGFHSKNNLRQHAARHSGEKAFACDQCAGRFATKASLTIHLRTHTGEKPYQCPDCSSAFNTHFSLSKHKRTHTGERPYVCEICGMRFNSSYHVRRHIRTHTGDKPYQCSYCERSFAQSNDLVKHKRMHVGKFTYQCPDCPESFRLSSELKEHVRQHFLEEKKRQAIGEGEQEVIVEEQIVS